MQSKSQIQSIGIDLGKTTFHLVALGSRCQVVEGLPGRRGHCGSGGAGEHAFRTHQDRGPA